MYGEEFSIANEYKKALIFSVPNQFRKCLLEMRLKEGDKQSLRMRHLKKEKNVPNISLEFLICLREMLN